jgi:hypothetical protein
MKFFKVAAVISSFSTLTFWNCKNRIIWFSVQLVLKWCKHASCVSIKYCNYNSLSLGSLEIISYYFIKCGWHIYFL